MADFSGVQRHFTSDMITKVNIFGWLTRYISFISASIMNTEWNVIEKLGLIYIFIEVMKYFVSVC